MDVLNGQQMERVNLKAVDSGGAYYKLSAFLDMSSDRTKVNPNNNFVKLIANIEKLMRDVCTLGVYTEHEKLGKVYDDGL